MAPSSPASGTGPAIYLDHNATAPLRPEAASAMIHALEGGLGPFGNPSSIHQDGRRARAALEDAREAVAALVGAMPERVTFTSGGSEANALALCGVAPENAPLLLGGTEHPSVLNSRPQAPRLPVDPAGRPDLDHLEDHLAHTPGQPLVALMLANNETGVVLPICEAAHLVRAKGGLLHCDAVQGPGRLPVDMHSLGCASLALSAHKIGGPPGIGALVLAPEVKITRPLLRGGGQERGQRAGTENLLGAIGFAAAARVVADRGRDEARRMASLRDGLEAALRQALPDVVIHGAGVARLPNTTCLALPGLGAQTLVMALDLAGIRVSAGSACSSGSLAPSAVLRAMGLDDRAAGAAIRLSLGPETTEAETTRAAETLIALVQRQRETRKTPGPPSAPDPQAFSL